MTNEIYIGIVGLSLLCVLYQIFKFCNLKNDAIKKSEKHEYTNFIDKINKVKPIVVEVLKTRHASRDSDIQLLYEVWRAQGAMEGMTYSTFKNKLALGELSNPDTITRTRRYLQAKYPELRGAMYEERKRQEKIVRNQIKLEL